ncbi:hypothetical protein Pint_05278 [Pistacia integerrima]|uniref:Uncharacterized protein n=1 Tax=Pistacia integerrima TaxID=434235 RepID=A0ACC0Z3A4_9ROSI|nr:hypothetical protein Pint_05278 [Pistacia integerrima]
MNDLCSALFVSIGFEERSLKSFDQVKNMNTDCFPPPCNEYELLKKKYIDESSERKWLYNEVIELKGHIRVFYQCRPLNQAEITNGSSSVVEFDSSQENELQIVSSNKQFKFDFVFKLEDNQEAVFAQTKPIVTSRLDGYNVCIFAYGQTGNREDIYNGGYTENRGVNYRDFRGVVSYFQRQNWCHEI